MSPENSEFPPGLFYYYLFVHEGKSSLERRKIGIIVCSRIFYWKKITLEKNHHEFELILLFTYM